MPFSGWHSMLGRGEVSDIGTTGEDGAAAGADWNGRPGPVEDVASGRGLRNAGGPLHLGLDALTVPRWSSSRSTNGLAVTLARPFLARQRAVLCSRRPGKRCETCWSEIFEAR